MIAGDAVEPGGGKIEELMAEWESLEGPIAELKGSFGRGLGSKTLVGCHTHG